MQNRNLVRKVAMVGVAGSAGLLAVRFLFPNMGKKRRSSPIAKAVQEFRSAIGDFLSLLPKNAVDGFETDVHQVKVYSRLLRPEGNHHKDQLPFILLAGAGLSGRYFIPLGKLLSQQAMVYIPDYPGCGWSGKPMDPPGVGELAETIRSWMDANGIDRAHLVGNSMGSQVAVELAYRYPKRVGKLVLTCPSVEPMSRTLPRQFGRFLINFPLEPLTMQMIYMLDYTQTGFLRMLRMLQRICRDPVETKLPYIQAPVLVVQGSRDLAVSQAWAEKVASLLPNSRLELIPGKAHCVMYSAADQVAQLTRDLIHSEGAEPEQLFIVQGITQQQVLA
ncbi:MAG TPA: alpha/beta hydrolase [Oligoflexus sp.]|uniref:alpha/beta fold hydrolase n=1 Tax=Oligoflexus sp. TaxID=1971216 RepID=UPI002D5B9B3A|nr:alpha/beta hydrolase [Oligoflexus sp.]HYX34833.1 alpha/beta hydrolase [Oligoflexus sp.]